MKESSRGTIFSRFTNTGQVRMFDYILRRLVSKEDMTFYMNGTNRKAMAVYAGLSEMTVNRNLNLMKQSGILSSPIRGVYKLNPDFISYGKE